MKKEKKLVIKLNGGNPVVLCSKCAKIIRYATFQETTNPLPLPAEYCKQCKIE